MRTNPDLCFFNSCCFAACSSPKLKQPELWQLFSQLPSLSPQSPRIFFPVPETPYQEPSSSPQIQAPKPQPSSKECQPKFNHRPMILLQASCNKPSNWSNHLRPRGSLPSSVTPWSFFWVPQFLFLAYLCPALLRLSCLGPLLGAPMALLGSFLLPPILSL